MRAARLVLILSLSNFPGLFAQESVEPPGVSGLGGRIEGRGYTRVLYRDRANDTFPGMLTVNYGRPIWKAEYQDLNLFDRMTRGQVWRMGNDFWTTLDTNLDLKIGGRGVTAGYYYLGIHRSQDGSSWSLVFMDPSKVRAKRLDASQIANAPIEFTTPLTQDSASETVEELEIALEFAEEHPTDITLRVSWGGYKLTTPVKALGIK